MATLAMSEKPPPSVDVHNGEEAGPVPAIVASFMCEACQNPIEEESHADGVVHMAESYWHRDCFTCLTCGRPVPIENDNVLLVGSQPMCDKCTFHCRACQRPIADEVVLCDQAPYHTQCFRCSTCQNLINSTAYVCVGDLVQCLACHASASTSPTDAAAGASVPASSTLAPPNGEGRQSASVPSSPVARHATVLDLLDLVPHHTASATQRLGMRQRHKRSHTVSGPTADMPDTLSLAGAPNGALEGVAHALLTADSLPAMERPVAEPLRASISDVSPRTDTMATAVAIADEHVDADVIAEAMVGVSANTTQDAIADAIAPDDSGVLSTTPSAPLEASPTTRVDPLAESTRPEEELMTDVRHLSLKERTRERLSDTLQSEILQAYYMSATPSGRGTPMADTSQSRRQSRTVVSALSDLWSHRESSSESDILRRLSLYDSEFEALIATPDFAQQRHSQPWDTSAWNAVAESSPLLETNPVSSDLPGAWPTSESLDSAQDPATLSDTAQLEIQRHMALAEFLAVKSATEEHKRSPDQSTHAKVQLVLESLYAHFDTIKTEYKRELESLAMMQQTLRHELRPMMQVRATLMQESQQLAQRVDELTAEVARLDVEASERVRRSSASTTETVHLAPVADPSVLTTPTGPSRSHLPDTPGTVSPAAPTSPATSSARLDASLPPLPAPRKFRWIKPRLILPPDLAAAGEALLLPAHELGKAGRVPSISPPVPPKHDTAQGSQQHLFEPTGPLPSRTRCMVCTQSVARGASEMRCHQCREVCHASCLYHVTKPCMGAVPTQAHLQRQQSWNSCVASPPGTSMLGRPLSEQLRLEGTLVPRLVAWCIAAVEANGLHDEGLYRKSGSSQQQRQLVQLFDSGQPFDLCDASQFGDCAVITGVLKSYLRKLPEPLIPIEHHDAFVAFAEHESHSPTAVPTMQVMLSKLPSNHYATLQRLCQHLHLVQKHQAETRMCARNLGLVFGPTILCVSDPQQELLEMATYARVVEFLIQHTPALFAL
ncbi:GTPase regulatory protein [Malassezia pachydermatis]|uniref:Signal transducer n=1 Tax=Malassezia pachydermatis TaxID=77020 RepID=A0A0M8MVU2_9BASI|nr:signal transducer [Malassezia pachydermatis]KOS15344.1 signal transducer [Malassezia pachydermatis]